MSLLKTGQSNSYSSDYFLSPIDDSISSSNNELLVKIDFLEKEIENYKSKNKNLKNHVYFIEKIFSKIIIFTAFLVLSTGLVISSLIKE